MKPDVNFPCAHHAIHTDAARRAADNVNMHFQAIGWDATGKWIAIRLADGSSDHALYDKKADAVRHQSYEFLCMYVKIVPMFMTVCEAQIMLDFNRKAYDNGFRMCDPDSKTGGKNLITRGRPLETIRQQMAAIHRKDI